MASLRLELGRAGLPRPSLLEGEGPERAGRAHLEPLVVLFQLLVTEASSELQGGQGSVALLPPSSRGPRMSWVCSSLPPASGVHPAPCRWPGTPRSPHHTRPAGSPRTGRPVSPCPGRHQSLRGPGCRPHPRGSPSSAGGREGRR